MHDRVQCGGLAIIFTVGFEKLKATEIGEVADKWQERTKSWKYATHKAYEIKSLHWHLLKEICPTVRLKRWRQPKFLDAGSSSHNRSHQRQV